MSGLVTSLIGDSWIKHPDDLKNLLKYQDDKKVLKEILKIKTENKQKLIELVKKENGIELNPDSIFDTQIKRLHAYKRQLLNVFQIISLYQKIKMDKSFTIHPRTFIFGAKAAPSYVYAKKIIELI